ncbi:MAG: hypothetical protein DI539_09460 [Flavobacterium psychrophilum]|nr:MAG: hypothetical protein DI539_09460 [Flavobacterium psychrophilum]
MANQVEILSLQIDVKALISSLADTKKQIDELKASQKELEKSGQGSSEQFVQQAATLKNLQQSYNRQLNVVQQLEAADKQAASAAAALTTALNKEVNSIDSITQSNKELKAIRNSLNASTEDGSRAIAEINKKLAANNEFIQENVSQAERQKMSVGGYADAIKEAFTNLNIFNAEGLKGFTERSREAGGAGALLKQSFSQMTSGIAGATKAAMGFILTPLGAAIAAVTAAFLAGKAIFDYNAGLQEANKELKALGVNAKDLSNVRSEITATAETFDKDFKEIASKANSLAKAYGISMSEANRFIAEGLANGGAQNAEFLDSLGEYDALFAKAGYSAQEFVNIVNQGYELGIYADKLPDAIKEADLALKEQGKATSDALKNAFGASFTDEILKQVRTGEKTTAEALDAIAKKSTETALTQQQQAQLTADVFKGAGEDAGGAAAIFEAINKSANKEMSETAKRQMELVESTEALSKAQAELFEVEGFGDIWTSVKVMATDALTAMLTYINDVKKDLQPLIDFVGVVLANAWEQLKTTVSVAFNLIKANIQIVTNALSTFFNFFKALVKGDFSGAIDALRSGFNNLLNIVNNTFAGIKNTIINGLQAIVKNVAPVLKALGVDIDALNKKLDGMKSKVVNVKANTSSTEISTKKNVVADVDPNQAANAKAAADATKKAQDEQAKAADALIKKYKQEIDLFIANQGIKKKSIGEQLALEKQIMDKRLALNQLEYSKGKISKEQYETQKLTITNTYLQKQADATVQIAQQELEAYKKGIEQKKADDTFFTDEKLKAKQKENDDLAQKERDFQALRLEAGVINEQEFNKAIDETTEQHRLAQEELVKQREEAKKEQELIDKENQLALDEEEFQNQFEIERQRELMRYQEEMRAAEKNGADTTKIKQKHVNNNKKIDEAEQSTKRKLYAETFGQIAQLMGENTAAGKVAGVANATINTYEGVSQVWAAKSALPEPMATIAKVASTATVLASGLSAVKKISGVKAFYDGGLVPTLSDGIITASQNVPTQKGGDNVLALVGRGEMILNKDQQRRAALLGGAGIFKAIGVPGAYANGGIVGGTTSFGNMGGIKIDMDALAQKIGQEVGAAYAQAPAPVVYVDDISTSQANKVRIESNASL